MILLHRLPLLRFHPEWPTLAAPLPRDKVYGYRVHFRQDRFLRGYRTGGLSFCHFIYLKKLCSNALNNTQGLSQCFHF